MSTRRPPLPLRLAVHGAVYAAAATMLVPFAWMVLTSLKADQEAAQAPSLANLLPAHPQWSNFAEAVRAADLQQYYMNSVIVALVTTILAVAHNALAGYAFAKMRFAGKRILFGLTLATMLLPLQCFFIFAYLICRSLGFVDNLQAMIVPFLASGFGIFYMRQAISTVPDALLEAGRIDGMTDLDLFWVIARPIAWPAITALAIFSFMNSWNGFFWPLIVVDSLEKKTLPLAVAALASGMYVQSWPVTMAAATILILPLIVIFFLTQRAFVRGIALTGVKE
ncbi:MAG: carbohydrate ABC transporter permease [Phycisphaerales bacterium]|nr:carbohydrate ABC transporter permease [Phycisphaerales bacterium]